MSRGSTSPGFCNAIAHYNDPIPTFPSTGEGVNSFLSYRGEPACAVTHADRGQGEVRSII